MGNDVVQHLSKTIISVQTADDRGGVVFEHVRFGFMLVRILTACLQGSISLHTRRVIEFQTRFNVVYFTRPLKRHTRLGE